MLYTLNVPEPNVSPTRTAARFSAVEPNEPEARRYTVPVNCTVCVPMLSRPRPLVPLPSVSNPTLTVPLCTPALANVVDPKPSVSAPVPVPPATSCVVPPLKVPTITPLTTAFSFSEYTSVETAVLRISSDFVLPNAKFTRVLPTFTVPPLANTVPLDTSAPTAGRYTVAFTATEVPARATVPNPVRACPTEFNDKVSTPFRVPAVVVLPP